MHCPYPHTSRSSGKLASGFLLFPRPSQRENRWVLLTVHLLPIWMTESLLVCPQEWFCLNQPILTELLPEWSNSKLSSIIGKYVCHTCVSFTTTDQIFWQWVIKALAYFVGFVKHSLSRFSEIYETFPIFLFGETTYKSVLPLWNVLRAGLSVFTFWWFFFN